MHSAYDSAVHAQIVTRGRREQSLTMEVTVTKVVVLILLGTIKLVCGLAPLVLARIFKKKRNNNNGYWVKKFIGEEKVVVTVA